MLVVFGGLPGTGKTTLARALAARRGAVYLRIDEIEQAIRAAGLAGADIGPAGYIVANALAASNLANGMTVVADSVNPVPLCREYWRKTAADAGAALCEVELVCSDPDVHRRRIETRRADIPGHTLPDWQAVLARDYTPWLEPHLVIDTASHSAEEALAFIEERLDG